MNQKKIDPLIQNKALKILDASGGNLCDRCLGRNFIPDIEATGNQERGEYIRKSLAVELCKETNENNPINEVNSENSSVCFVCNDIFQFIDDILIEHIVSKLNDLEIEFSTFLVGSRVPPETLQRENEIQQTSDSDPENLKKEINREIGKALSLRLAKEVEFETPNLVILVDLSKDRESPHIELQINPLFLEGRYKKLIRGIPQTKWPCRECKGRGCERCNYTGKMYQESVEELISPEILKETGGSESKFHGAGREDIDVKMLGTGRPFVLEIKEPQKRDIDLKILEQKINIHAAGKVEVSTLKMVDKARRSQIKTSSTDTYKVYHAKVDLDKEISQEDLMLLNTLNVIEQRTPKRVVHRRADIIRERKIRYIKTKKLDDNILEMIIECQGGLYIKELISGDEERTQPSVSSLLKTPAKCVQLDVLDVHLHQ
jgi:tRNA pseudouridine synthase 10